MASNPCIDAITQALGREPTEAEVERIAEAVQVRLKNKMADGTDARTAAKAVGDDMANEAKMQKATARWVAFNNIIKKADLNARNIPGDQVRAERAVLSGVSSSGRRNAGTSIQAVHHMERDRMVKPAAAELKAAGVLDYAKSKDPGVQLRIAQELRRREDPTLEKDTGDARAKKVAEVLGGVLDQSRALLNLEGAFIGKVDGYMGRQYHDMWKIRGATFEQWRDELARRTDLTKDYPDSTPEQMNSKLRAEYQSHTSGIYDTSNNVGGQYSVANKVSQERSHNFNSAADWLAYNEKFGKGGVVDAIWAQADKSARDASIMRTFGTTPKATFDEWHDTAMRRAYDRGDMKEGDKLKAQPNNSLFDLVSGISRVPGNHTLATIGANVRSAQQILHLGSIMGSALVHVPLNSLVLRSNGVPFLEGMMGQLRAMLPRGAEFKEVASQLHAGMDGMTGHLMSRFNQDDAMSGRLADSVNTFHRFLSLFSPFMDAQRAGVGVALSHQLGQSAEREFAALNPRLQASLRRYGIEQPEWDAARPSAAKADDGRMHLIPDSIEDQKLKDKFQTYISDQIAEGANEPTAYARNLAALGTSPGTWSGELMRSMMQFKSFAITMMERQWGRELYRGGLDVPGVMLLAGMTTGFGFLGQQLRNLTNNTQQHVPQDAAGWVGLIKDSMVNGGAMGLVGDAMRSNLHSSADFAKSVMGPAFTLPADAISGLKNTIEGGKKGHEAAGLDALHQIGQDVTPNYWATTAAYNYLTPYMIANAIHPGAVARHEKVLRDHNQSFVLRPGG